MALMGGSTELTYSSTAELRYRPRPGTVQVVSESPRTSSRSWRDFSWMDAQKPGLGHDEDEPVVVPTEAPVELARPIHVPAFAHLSRGRENVVIFVLALHDLAPGRGGEADGLVREHVVGGYDEASNAFQEGR